MDLLTILLGLFILVFSAILHEVAHGYVADRLGDPTARLLGRLTLNPLRHIDPFFSVLLPLLLIMSGSPVIFGGAKPVPIDPFNFQDGRKDTALVSLAGPGTNVLLAVTAAILIHVLNLIPNISSFIINPLSLFLNLVVIYNLLLAIFNLLPIPPLDGSKIFALLLPEQEANAYLGIGQMGILLLLILLSFNLGGFSLEGFILTILNFGKTLLGI